MTVPDDLATLRDNLIRDYDIEQLARVPSPEALAALDRVEAEITRLQEALRLTNESYLAAEAEVARLQQERDAQKLANAGLIQAVKQRDARVEAAEARVAQLQDGLRELVEYLEEQDPFPTSDGHPLYAARALLAEDGK